MKLTYENALKLLETRKRKGRPQTPAVPPARQNATSSNDTHTVRGTPSLVGMKEWLQILGHSDDDVKALNIIHIAGTKGKGSTCAFTRGFLHTHSLRTGFPKRIGLYTSPHLQCIQERIQIDDQPITEDIFTRYFFEVWEGLASSNLEQATESIRQPRYLQLLALLAFHTFIRENVDAAIFETHHGGEYDATNVIEKPVVTGITSLGMDHIAQLGPTIENIAWHKAGIFKTGAPAFSVPQEAGPAQVLRSRATEKMVPLTVPVQRLNCSLALDLSRIFLQIKAPDHKLEPGDISAAIENFTWIGRFEIVEDGLSQWFLDGAHNTLSLEQAAIWFSKNTTSSAARKHRVLIFSHLSEHRDGATLVECLAHTLSQYDVLPDDVVFTTYEEREDGSMSIGRYLRIYL
ncbi:folylpolyglutamate synthase [Aspergillus nomiae NRRL 13137]|uniref:tetrahydrofolate synthase n=1 Tax=Aspergillus nomiae NRRL (strain ATCC 15546 / NRRL 13137 / CBS 260.88 / M93) TaxID=1509407 RepID=A0A0L1IUR6_ASPN3|nr:folylpolyglutamate synthase [Aspergillus nomiae NRRL 13137]KNG83160.1 folylpolyglutamate synthase [Aspergillus nomiae NRRL 13137]